MFLVRAAFWLTVVLLLIPGDPESQEPAPRVGLFQALGAAQSAVNDLSQICEREPAACETGSNALGVLGQKLRYGTKLVTKYLEKPAEAAADDVSAGSLRLDEIRIPWQRPAPDKPA